MAFQLTGYGEQFLATTEGVVVAAQAGELINRTAARVAELREVIRTGETSGCRHLEVSLSKAHGYTSLTRRLVCLGGAILACEIVD